MKLSRSRKINVGKTIRQVLIFLSIITFALQLLPKTSENKIDALEIVLYSIIGLLSSFQIAKEIKVRAYSFNLMHWVFILFFFFVAPIVQISKNYTPYGISQSLDIRIATSLQILLWCIFYSLAYSFAKNKTAGAKKKSKNTTYKKGAPLIVTSINIISSIILISMTGFINLFSRGTASINIDNATASSLLSHGLRAAITCSTAVSLLLCIKNKQLKYNIYAIINVILLFITCFPAGMARNMTGIIYLGLYTIIRINFYKKNKNSIRYFALFIISFVIIFPFLNSFRRVGIETINIGESIHTTFDNITNDYATENYDAFSMIGTIRQHSISHGKEYGKQLMGSFLFFIPRKIYSNKPVGTGSMVLTAKGKEFTNVSAPLIAEGQINFGTIGVILFSVICGVLASTLDKRYWNTIDNEEDSYLKLVYPFLLPAFFFMMRGDMMSTYSNMAAYIVIFYIMYKVVTGISTGKSNDCNNNNDVTYIIKESE